MAPARQLLAGLVISSSLCGALPVGAQQRPLSQFQSRVWTEEDGLPVNSIAEIRQTPDGYLWVGTESGLARFDGARFLMMDSPESPLYTSSHVSALGVEGGGDLWIGTTTGLIRRTATGTTRWEGSPRELATAMIEDVQADPDAGVWVSTTGEGLFLVTSDSFATSVPARGFTPRSIRDVALSRDGLPWVATDEGLARVGPGGVLVHVAGGQGSRDARTVVEDSRGRVWVGAREGLFRLIGDRLVPAAPSGPLTNTLIRDLVEDRAGQIWAATSGYGVYRLSGDRWERFGAENGLPSDDLHAVATDARGDVWVGTGGGLALLYEGDVTPITRSEGLSAEVALPVMEDRDGGLWVGTFKGGVTHVRDGRVRTVGRSDGLPHDVVLSLTQDSTGRIWIGTRAGLRIFDGRALIRAPTGVLDSASVAALLTDRSGRVWAGTTQGLHLFEGDRVRSFGAAEGIPNPWVISLHQARDGSMLVGTQGSGAYRLRNGRAEPITSHARSSTSIVLSFHESADGTLWMAADEGLIRLRDGEQVELGRLHGIPDGPTARILSDGLGFYWIGTNRGIYRTSKAQLDSVADGTRAAISPRMFTKRDGMPSSETNGGFHPAGWRGRDGRLFFPTMGGVAALDPAAIAAEGRLLRVVVEGLQSGDAVSGRELDLPSSMRDLSIRYTALDFRDADEIQFRYRLAGYDTAWISAGGRRTAYYTHVPPGRYTFVAQARLPGEQWQSAEPMPIRIRPFLYETIWFRLAVVLLIGLTILAIHKGRVRVLRQRQVELEELVRARERAELRYREIFENAREIVITLDPGGKIVEANRETCRVLGCDPEALSGTPLDSLVISDGEGPVSDPHRLEHIADQQELLEMSLVKPDGSSARIEASVRELAEDGRRAGFQLIGRDITERRVLEERLRQSQRTEAVGLLAGGIAHDFNNILSVISGYATLVHQGLGKASPLRDDVQEISEAADRAAALTHQLLAFSRKQTLRPRIIQLNHVVLGIEKLLRRLIGEDVEFRVDLAPGLPHVKADPGQMEQVITNLAVNARDAMPGGGELIIRTRKRRIASPLQQDGVVLAAGEYVVLSVIDSGLGMSPAVRARIFDPFFTTKETGRGTGLGLATVHGIVDQSGGEILVESAPGRGATFDVYLPVEQGALEPEEVEAPEPDERQGHETILVVDDEASIRRLVRRVLEKSGYRILEAPNGPEALEGFPSGNGRIDLLLTDVVMPQMSGPDLAEQLSQAHPEMKIIFMSGYTDDQLAPRVISRTVLRKPFGPPELLRRVREALEEQKIERT